MPLHPQAQEFLELAHQAPGPPLYEMTALEARAAAGGFAELIGPGPEVAAVDELSIPVRDAQILGRRYVPRESRGTIVWLHGGGWVLDGLDSSDAMCRVLANHSGATVIGVDYRVAPEHPFPTPLDDSFDALRWVAGELGAARGPLLVGGDSAGGNMAAVCAVRARDGGGPALAGQILVYPVTDCDMTTLSYVEHGASELLLLESRTMKWFWDAYVPDEALRVNPEISPLRTADLSRLPPAIVVLAGYDPLRDEGLAYADRLRMAGVPVSLSQYDDMPHIFFSFVNLFSTGDEAVAKVGAGVRELIAAA